MITTKRIEKVWVITWPKGTTKEYKGQPKPTPKDFESLSVETFADFKFRFFENGKWRTVIGGCQAVFANKKEAKAWMKTQRYEKCFVLRPAYLSIF